MGSPNCDLDLDSNESIRKYESSINTNFKSDTIYKLIEIIRNHSLYIGMVEYNGMDAYQHSLRIKYLEQILLTVFEHDCAYQHLYILLYNQDRTKTHLKIYLSITDDPIISYVEKDQTGLYSGCSGLKSGEYLINFAHRLVSFIGFTRMRLDDDSRFGQTKLWLYSLITKGKPWYSKFGYYPAIVSESELQMRINEVREIRLDSVAQVLRQTEDAECSKLLSLIGDSKQTIEEYARMHSIEEFGELSNCLFVNFFSKKCQCDWFQKFEKLRIANVHQVNNCINQFCAKLIQPDPKELSQ